VIVWTVVFALSSSSSSSGGVELSDQNVWIPELRGIPIGKRGETVAEFNVKTPDSKIPTATPEVTRRKESNRIRRRRPSYSTVAAKAANLCRDAETSIELFREDGFSGHEVTLEAETPIVGIFGIDFRSVVVRGKKCCWEMFDRVGYSGKMLRLCPGKYGQEDIGNFAERVRSMRPVDHFRRYAN